MHLYLIIPSGGLIIPPYCFKQSYFVAGLNLALIIGTFVYAFF